MKLLTKDLCAKLSAQAKQPSHDHIPIVKLFTPDAQATWLLTELADDGDTAFGLCDLGHGYVELGPVSISELESVTGPMGLTVERDRYFQTTQTKALSNQLICTSQVLLRLDCGEVYSSKILYPMLRKGSTCPKGHTNIIFLKG